MPEGTVAADQLRLFIERIERLEEEKRGITDDVRDVYAEAKSNGYDPKTMRKIVALRRMEKFARDEADALLHTYREALGMGQIEMDFRRDVFDKVVDAVNEGALNTDSVTVTAQRVN